MQISNENEPVIEIVEASRRLGVQPSGLYYRMATGQIPTAYVPGKTRGSLRKVIRLADFERFAAGYRRRASRRPPTNIPGLSAPNPA